LAHPAINVNALTSGGSTPFSLSCLNGQVSVVQLLLKDPRVDVTVADKGKCTPLWLVACFGNFEVVMWLIASGRDLGDLNKKGKWQDGKSTALEIATKENETEIASLLQRFMVNPAQTRHALRVELGRRDELAAEVFALVVFLCDNLLQASFHHLLQASHKFSPSLLRHCWEVADGAADDPVPSCRWVNEAEYSSQGFRGRLQISCQECYSFKIAMFDWCSR